MADEKAKTWYGEIEATITDTIKENRKRDITAVKLQGVLLDIVKLLKGKWLFGGVVQPSSQVDITGDVPTFYIAFTEGTYTNFGNNEVADGEFALFMPNLNGNWDVHKWGIGTLLDGKVDKENGYGLSQNDYTDEDRDKVASLPDSVAGKSGDTFQEGNFASFDEDGNLQDSNCNEGTFIKGVKKGTETLNPEKGVVTIPSDIESAQATSVPSNQSAKATIDGNHVLQLEIPRGADAMNPFKGWFDAITTGTPGTNLVVTDEDGNLVAAYPNPIIGDYAYIKTWDIDTTQSPQVETPITKIYECTTAGSWSDSGRTADMSNVQTFARGEKVHETYIDNTHLENPTVGSLAKAEDIPTLVKKVYSEGENPPDLYISDEDGNALVEVGNGHIKTKNFDSRNVQNVTMEVVGSTLKITIQ